MATETISIFQVKSKDSTCGKCKKAIEPGGEVVVYKGSDLGLCMRCSPFKNYVFVPAGDAALTRRSKKHSKLCGELLTWNRRIKRYHRLGIYVEEQALAQAEEECEADKLKREEKNKKAAVKREIEDKEYIQNFALATREQYPNCPRKREFTIAKHACAKYSGRVGRTADAKKFDEDMIERAVIAHIRHSETNYDELLSKGYDKRSVREQIYGDVQKILNKWK